MELAGTLPNADTLIETATSCRPAVIMMDVTMSGRDPLDALAHLRACCPEIRTVIYSGRSDQAIIDRATQAGAEAFVDKAKPPSHLLEVIRRVARTSRPAL
jgi:DNA-binding NarL/FixJ family response regulator